MVTPLLQPRRWGQTIWIRVPGTPGTLSSFCVLRRTGKKRVNIATAEGELTFHLRQERHDGGAGVPPDDVHLHLANVHACPTRPTKHKRLHFQRAKVPNRNDYYSIGHTRCWEIPHTTVYNTSPPWADFPWSIISNPVGMVYVPKRSASVSYTHLTLPTICSV